MDIASDGTIFLAAEVEDVLGHAIVVMRSDDGGSTWTQWSGLGLPGLHYVNPSVEIAEGDVDRLFIGYEVKDSLTSPQWGAIRVAYHALDEPSANWVVHTISEQAPYPPTQVRVAADDALRSDYGVFVLFGHNAKFYYEPAFARSLDQGATWEEFYRTFESGLFNVDFDLAFGRDDVLHVIFKSHRGVRAYRVANRGASPTDWSSLIELANVRARAPQIVSRPGTDQVFALYTDRDLEVMNIHQSDDDGLTWTTSEESSAIEARDGEFELTPMGYRIGGYAGANAVVVGEPVTGADPAGEWNLNPIPGGFSSVHTAPVQVAWNESQGGRAALLAHAETGTEERLMFWGEWFDDAATVADAEQDVRLHAWPNPAAEGVQIASSSAAPGQVEFSEYDISGRAILRRTDRFDGDSMSWDLRDLRGLRVPRGIYVLDLRRSGLSLGRTQLIPLT